jgi:hypothetical protein
MMAGQTEMHRQSRIRLAMLDEPWQRFPLVLIAAILFLVLDAGRIRFLAPAAGNERSASGSSRSADHRVTRKRTCGWRRWFSCCQPRLFNIYEVQAASVGKAFA